jgi:hypothetical protein
MIGRSQSSDAVTMKKDLEKEWALTIAPDTVRHFILKARVVSAAVNEDYDSGHEHEVELDDQARDTHAHDGLAEEESDDLTAEELRELIGDLNVDEAAELVALPGWGAATMKPANGKPPSPRPGPAATSARPNI